ncbi:sporulation integral membrane protein YlbJ [Bacillus massilinigeriensis]|uniref:sporulation integral membrane protein YlbJ n=1 Tax=Bacillus mediterraneensis TaxID=1805474 RepID=UPI000A64E791|nr:sporulation integral membrane protein YlbJ [Bacillus mediterraneensis]
MQNAKLKTLFLATVVTLMAFSLIAFPQEAFDASIRGLDMWWEIVFPSLLPFFIVSEMLIGFGVVKFIGFLLEPLMRPLFRVPGAGGFVWAMGMASGYPSGAKLTARLRQEGQLTRLEAERLVCFTNSSNPLFIFGAVSVGFFYDVRLGVILALAHYLGNFTVGLIMRFHGAEEKPPNKKNDSRPTLRKAFQVLHTTRLKDNRPIGKMLGDAVMSSVHTLLMIGGFIILFSVINKLLFHLQITGFISFFLEKLFLLFHLPVELSLPFLSGLFEITLGSQMTSQAQDASLLQKAIITSMVLGFSGFSVQAQVASILAQTDIRFKPFFIARILHGCFAGIYALILWNPLYLKSFFQDSESSLALPVFRAMADSGWNIAQWHVQLETTGPIITIFTLCCYIYIQIKRTAMTKA